MRPIKFKAVNKKTKEIYDVIQINFSLESVMVNSGAVIKVLFFKDIELLQFTGFFDKNGKEIFEGDVVLINHSGPKTLKVVWVEDGWEIKHNGSSWPIRVFGRNRNIKVIGNVHQNPELLEG